MKQKYPIFSALLALAFSSGLNAQIFYSNGAIVAVTTGGMLHCNGGLTLDNVSNFTNDGSVDVVKNSPLFLLPGTMTINSGSASGNGYYKVEQDWINNSVFVGGTSTVELNGNTQQFITSINSTVTTFHNLKLTGTGTLANRKKTLLLVNAMTDASGGVLNIGDRELETQINTFFVNDPAVAAVVNLQVPGSEGFVSSDAPGVLSRATKSTGTYLFPTGSSVVATRYRPIDVKPTATNNDIYTVRFINHNPDNDTYNRATNDGLICTANDTFYHAILRPSGNDAADISVYFIPATDGPWNGVSHWRTSNNMWNDIAAATSGISGIFTTRTRAAWAFANPGEPYVLTELKPAAPSIVCPSFCENSSNNLFVATGGAAPFTWTIPGNGTIIGGQGTDSLYVNWTTGTAAVTVVSVSPLDANCFSLPATCSPTVYPSPVAQFVTDTTGSGPWASTWNFVDQTTGATSWVWDFGNGSTSTQQNPINTYTGAGTYTVTLTATDSHGCVDTVQSIVTVLEGLLIPNVFSPNGDGTNDEFYIPNSGLKEFKIEIFDRWGVKIFESEAPAIHWDGHSTSGQKCSDGTYYYILHALTDTRDYSTSGFLTLIGSGKQ